MSNFCRITGHTRGLPKTCHFFPLLPPISPAEAKNYRTNSCRITSNFNPNHNYVPIKSYLDSAHVSKCPITRNSLFKYKHFQFIAPVVSSKSSKKFFYLLDSKVLLVPDEIEFQMKQGIITDVQISNHTIGFKYNYKVKEYDLDVLSEVSEDNLIFGKRGDVEVLPGGGIPVVKKRRIGGKRRGSIAQLTQVFQDKEKKAEKELIKSVEKISPDAGKVNKVHGKLEEIKRKKSVVIVPDILHEEQEAMDITDISVATTTTTTTSDQVVPTTDTATIVVGPPRYLLHDGSTVEEIDATNADKIKGCVTGSHVQYGKIINGEFTPGQTVTVTDRSSSNGVVEKFIPGMMVDGHFTPGQIVTVSPGGDRKFIPGQVMEIEGSKKFVPGQLVLEDESGAFKFVPGRIAEDGSFHPGEIVEIPGEGLKFVCDKMVISGGEEHTTDFELQTFELEDPILFDVDDVKRVFESASVVPVEFDACCNVIFEQAVFERKVDERVIGVAKEWAKGEERKVVLGDLVEAIAFARLLGNETVAAELEGVLKGDEEVRCKVLGDPDCRLILMQLVVLHGIVGEKLKSEDSCSYGNQQTGVIDDKAIFKSNVVAKVLLDEGVVVPGATGSGGRAGGGGGSSGGSGGSIGSGGGGGGGLLEADELVKMDTTEVGGGMMETTTTTKSSTSYHKSVVTSTTSKEVVSTVSVEEHGGAVIQMQSVHGVLAVEEEAAVTKRQRLATGEVVAGSVDLDAIISPESVELLDTTPAKHKLSLARQLRKKSGGSGGGEKRTTSNKIVLKSGEELLADGTLLLKNERDLILYELIETEEEFVRDLDFVLNTYYKEIESSPKFGKYRDMIFEDFKAIHSFHRNSLLEAIRYYQDDPVMIAKSFLRLERDFEPHVRYYQDHLKIEEIISNDIDLLEFIEDLSVSSSISDSKRLSDHLKLPLQRINDYVLIFKDLLDVCGRIHDDPVEREVLHRVLEFLVAIPQKLDDRKFLNSIEGIDAGVIAKLGRLLGHDWFVVTVTDHHGSSSSNTHQSSEDTPIVPDAASPKNRYVFLFRQKLLVTKVKRISEQRSVFVLKLALHIPDYFVECLGARAFRLVSEAREVAFEASGNNNGSAEGGGGALGTVDAWVHELGKAARREGEEEGGGGEDPRRIPGGSGVTTPTPPPPSQQQVKVGGTAKPSSAALSLPGVGVELLNVPYEEESCTSSSDQHTVKAEEEEEEEVKKPKAAATATTVPAATTVKKDNNDDASHHQENKQQVVPEQQSSQQKSSQQQGKEQTHQTPSSQKSAPGDNKKEAVASSKGGEVVEGQKPAAAAAALGQSKQAGEETPQKKKEEAEKKTRDNSGTTGGEKNKEQQKQAVIKKESVASEASQQQKPLSTTEPPQQSRTMDAGKEETPPPSLAKLQRRRSSVIMARQTSVTDLKIIEPMQSAECEPGDNATFTLKVSSNNTIISWLKGNRPLDDKLADRVKIESKGNVHSLTLLNCKEEDASLYTAKVCELIGGGGGGISEPVTCSAVLVVHQMSPAERKEKTERDSPHFLVKFKDTELLKNTTVNFLFLITGNPDPDVVFKRDGKKLIPEDPRLSITRVGLGKYELKIERIEEGDAGTYTVTATNKHGSSDVSAKVRVVDEKDVFNEGTAMHAGDAVGGERKGLIQPGEEVQFSWFRDGKSFEPGEDFKVLFKDDEDTLALVFQHVKPEDAGLYTCVAATSSGRISCSAELTVQGGINQLLKEPEAPKITASLTDTEVSVGGSAMMELKVTGFPKPSIQWLKDKSQGLEAGGRVRFLYEDDESIALIIKNVTYDDEGLYTVVATNDLGKATTEGRLLVRQPPRFMKKMQDHEMMAEKGFTIEVEVEGNPKPELKWYKDGQLIVSSERIKFVQSADGQKYTMCIERVTLDDTGAYSVVASNAVGQMSEFWNVLATMPARFVERLPANQGRDIGDDGGQFVVKVAGVPDPKVEFKFDGKDFKYEKLDHQVYRVVVPELKDRRDYELVGTATNQFAKDESVCVFNVRRGVKILDGLKDVLVEEHGEVEVGVKVDCYPKPTSVKWFIDNVEICGKAYEQKVDGARYSLVVKDAFKEDGCKFAVKVVIDNGMGADESSATITMQAPPVISKGLSPLYRLENSTTQELNVTLKETTPTPVGTWYHNGKEVQADARIKISKKSTETYTLTFDAVKYEDAGEWAFKAVNDIGEVWSKTTVIVEGKPQFTSPLPNSMRILETETYDLEVNILDYCEEKVKIEWKADVETTFKPLVQANREGDSYHSKVTFVPNRKERYFKVVATNKYGESESICQIDWIELVPPKIVTPLKETYTIQDGAAFHFESEVEGVPKPKVVWLFNGAQVDENVTKIDGTVTTNTVGEYTLQATNKAGEAISKTKLEMLQTAPTVANLDDTYNFKENEEDLVLSVDISGSPIPTVTWLKDGTPIDLNDPRVTVTTTPTKSTLVVKNAAREDKGAYSCNVSNGNGSAQGRANVEITFAPKIDGSLVHPEMVTKNTWFEIKGKVAGEPFPEVCWVHPTGKIIAETEPGVHEVKVYADGSVSLAIECAQMTDGGIYTLVARNLRGEATIQSGIINVEAPRTRPRINPPLPAQIKLIEGQPLTLRTTVKAHPLPELSLTFEDAPIPFEQRTIENGLEFEHKLQKAETSGTYVLKASNSEGSTQSECKLIVVSRLREGALTPPAFIQELVDKKVVNEGAEMVLVAKVDGNPIPEVQVLKDGQVIDMGDHLEFDGTVVKLRLPETRMADAGEYTLKLVNGNGEVASRCVVSVNKVYRAPEFLQRFTDQAQLPTRDCKFGGKVAGFPAPEVRWLKDGNELDLTKSDKYRVRVEDDVVALQVRNCDDSDIGVYTCELSNVEGKAVCNAKLDVVETLPPQGPKTELPYFLKTIGSTEVYPGMQAKFTACIGGNPEPEAEWYRDGKRVIDAPGSRIQFIRDGIGAGLIKLVVNDTNVGDLGEYKLKIFNELGEASCVATLKFDTFDARGRKEQSPLGDYYRGYSDLRPTALPDRPVITRMDGETLTLNWKPALPNVHSEYPCTYLLEMAPADSNDWKTVYSGLKNCHADVEFPSPTLDYKFRVRVQWGEKYVSEPSPYVITNRNKLNLPPLHWQPMVVPSIPRSYDLTLPPHPDYTHAPRFLNSERDIQFAARGTPATVCFAVYGYPKPTVSFKFNGAPSQPNHTYTDNGIVTVYLNEMTTSKIGRYECIATNPHGIASQAVELRICEYPRFVDHLRETHVCARKNGRLHCVVRGDPCPTIRLFKDWHASAKPFQVVQIDEYTVAVNVLFEDTLLRDEGLYSIVATNHAGSIHSSAMLRVYEDESAWTWNNYGVRSRVLRLRKCDPNDYYHFGEIIGRGTQGVHFHVVETRTGGAWAAKRMIIGDSPMSSLHRHMIETEIENWANVNSPHVVRLYDGFFDNRTFVLVNELCNGGDLFGHLIYELEDFDEEVVRRFVLQIVTGLRDLHESRLWVCGLQPLDILLTHKRSNLIKLTDFGLSRFNDPTTHRYSHPEFASPELISGSAIGAKTDIWSLGVIVYVLLTGHHPYVGLNDQETMENLKNWNGNINEQHVSRLSASARSFLSSLLRINPGDRPTAEELIGHEWFVTGGSGASVGGSGYVNLFNEGHVRYYNHLRAWQSNADCIEFFRRNPLEVAYKHPSKMVYPPGYDWVEEREFKVITKSDFSFERPYVEIDEFASESHYTSGDDTYLLQLRDTDFPARLRQYMKVAASQSPSFALHLQGSYYDRNVPIILERRKFTDVMDEEVDDERRQRIVEYGEGPINSEPRRLRHEVGTRLDIQAEADAIIAMKREGREPCFRERPSAVTYVREFGGDLEIRVLADGEPVAPDVQWFKNDTLLQSNDPVHRHRLEVSSSQENTVNRSRLIIHSLKNTDLTNYKVIARNKQGQSTWKFRVALLPEGKLMPRTLPTPEYSVEKNPTPLSTEAHAFESVSTPEVLLKGAFTNVLRSGDTLYRVSSGDEFELVKTLVHHHVLGGEYTQAIQVGSGVAMSYSGGCGVLLPLLEHFISMGEYTEQNVVNVMEQVLHGLSYLHWSGVACIGLGPGSIAVDQSTGTVKIIDLSAGQRINRVGVPSELANGRLNGRLNLERDLEFVAPEALMSSESHVTGQADIWSVGVLIYLLLSGHSPFKGDSEDETKQNILFVRFRFEHLYKDLTQEATRLIMLIFKRSPLKRPSAEECFEHRWFQPAESLARKRSHRNFGVDKLKAYTRDLLEDSERSSSSPEHSNNVLADFYRVHNLA